MSIPFVCVHVLGTFVCPELFFFSLERTDQIIVCLNDTQKDYDFFRIEKLEWKKRIRNRKFPEQR